ncbi:CP family cyanate transporter-like MFS transporter [Microbacterium terrae]|uniref:Transporter YycB n=1 Tax=Microbacterium terrae TaxID=69369 RepID=A0A0M2HKI8_9MICO|nr:MFS transporter [Microbacterium terrae]KJL45393.1 putative transporter YycB [Microbacterium terrae]MBP1078736.1 CP family cyanate transporter-like MFS transporter [Microbacterium terrae]GLJ98137.1 putative MFS transporter [Microbacterium terrae]
MTSSPARPLWRGRALALVGIVLVAFSLRSAVASLSPLFDHIQEDLDLPAAVVGLIGTAPPVCFAVFGLLAPAFERRFGLERLTAVAIAVVAVGLVARSLAPNALMLLAGTAVVFAAVGTANILLPPLVKRYFPDRIGLMTTIFSTTMAVSTFIPPLVAVPLADAADWRVSLGLWAVFALVAVLPWVGLAARRRADADPDEIEQPSPRVFGRMWQVPLAWALLVAFAVSSTVAYTSFAWMPKMLVDIAGVEPATAGALLSLFGFMGLPASLIVPFLVVRAGATRILFGAAVVFGLSGIAGLLFAPTAATWLWVALLGLAPLLFPMILVLLGLRTRTHEGAVALSGFVQSGGYAIAAFFPLGIGILHDATDAWTAPLIVLAVVISAAIPAGVIVARSRTIEEDWERRHGTW